MHPKALSVLTIALLAVPPLLAHSASGTMIGVVCFSQTGEPCSAQAPIFTGMVGSIFRVSVFVSGTGSFSQFQVLVKTNPSVLNPLDADAIGSVLVSTEGVPVGGWQCINGGGAYCGPQDGPGVVNFFGFGRYATTAPTLGVLFSIDYTSPGPQTDHRSPLPQVARTQAFLTEHALHLPAHWRFRPPASPTSHQPAETSRSLRAPVQRQLLAA